MPSRIEYTNSTWNPITGCDKVSAGCTNCYAERMARRLHAMGSPNYRNGFKLTLHPEMLDQVRKWRKPRMVFLGRKTIRAIRRYLRYRKDNHPALWVSIHGERMTYAALRCLLRRRAEQIGMKSIPTPHDFRRAFALVMLRNDVDIFALQKINGTL